MNKGVVIGAACAILSACAAWWIQDQGRRELAAASLPPAADLSGWSGTMKGRIAERRERVSQGKDYRKALVELSRLYHANGFMAEAAQCYQGLMALEPGVARWPHLLGDILAGAGRLEEALPLAEKASGLEPGYLPARVRLGDIYWKLDRIEDAATVYRSILEADAKNPYGLLGLARLDLARKDWAGAVERLEQARSVSGQRIGIDLLVTAYEGDGQQGKAASLRGLQKSFSSHADIADPWHLEIYDECFDPYRLSLAGGQGLRGEDPAAGIRLLSRAIALSPKEAYLHFQLAQACQDLGRLPEAIRSYERCVEIDPKFSDGWAFLSATLRAGGDDAGADAVLARGLSHCPNSPGLMLDEARRLMKSDRNAEALALLKAVLRIRPEEADPLVAMANIYLLQGKFDEGVASLEAALAVEPGHPAALSTLAFQAINSKSEAEARKRLSAVVGQPRVPREAYEELQGHFVRRFGKPAP